MLQRQDVSRGGSFLSLTIVVGILCVMILWFSLLYYKLSPFFVSVTG